MGDIADWLYDQAMDSMPDDYYGFTRYEPRVLTCRHCLKTGLVWGMATGGWRLFEGRTPHNCTSADDFDVLE